jgi:mono/diheme cytochrome c family protein
MAGFHEEHRVIGGDAGRIMPWALMLGLIGSAASAQAPAPIGKPLQADNPVPATKESIAAGKRIFMQNCTQCHGADGRARADFAGGGATDLTQPSLYKHGTSDAEIFRSISDGAGLGMPAFKVEMSDKADIWSLVNFIHTLWPAADAKPEAAPN